MRTVKLNGLRFFVVDRPLAGLINTDCYSSPDTSTSKWHGGQNRASFPPRAEIRPSFATARSGLRIMNRQQGKEVVGKVHVLKEIQPYNATTVYSHPL